MIEEILRKYNKFCVIKLRIPGTGIGAMVLITMNLVRYCERMNYYPLLDFRDGCQSPFYDSSQSADLWTQFFKPISSLTIGDIEELLRTGSIIEDNIYRLSPAKALVIAEQDQESIYSYPFGIWRAKDLGSIDAWYALQRAKGRETLAMYFGFKKEIAQKAADFFESNRGTFNLGIHIRGTDLHYAPPVAPAEYFEHIDKTIINHPESKIFIATDQLQYIEVMEKRYGSRLFYFNCFRSDNNQAIFDRPEIGPQTKGEEALIDVLLLSKCDYLIKGSSNLSEMAIYLNPNLECTDLSYKKIKAYGEDYGINWSTHSNKTAWELVGNGNIEVVAKDVTGQSIWQSMNYQIRKKAKLTRIIIGKYKQMVFK